MEPTCQWPEGCTEPARARGLCTAHYQRARYAGTLDEIAPKRPRIEAWKERGSAGIGICENPRCPLPNREFEKPTVRARFCSRTCKDAVRWERRRPEHEVRKCKREECENMVERGGKAVFCSLDCNQMFHNRKKADAVAAERLQARMDRPPCKECGKPIPLERRVHAEFCKPSCAREWNLKHGGRERNAAYNRQFLYGITQQEYDALLEKQGGKCAICKRYRWGGKHNVPNVDHCHESSRVRGLLCDGCNRGIGLFEDNAAFLRAAAEYVET